MDGSPKSIRNLENFQISQFFSYNKKSYFKGTLCNAWGDIFTPHVKFQAQNQVCNGQAYYKCPNRGNFCHPNIKLLFH
jgi:hypothetical protein